METLISKPVSGRYKASTSIKRPTNKIQTEARTTWRANFPNCWVTNYFQKAYINRAVSNEKPSFPEITLTDSGKVFYNEPNRDPPLKTYHTRSNQLWKKYSSGYMWYWQYTRHYRKGVDTTNARCHPSAARTGNLLRYRIWQAVRWTSKKSRAVGHPLCFWYSHRYERLWALG